MSGPPTNSASVNCHPSSKARMIRARRPGSWTRSRTPMAAVKLAPFRNSARARATAAYEHDDDAAAEPGGDRQRAWVVATEEPLDGAPAHHGLDEPTSARIRGSGPQNLPTTFDPVTSSAHGEGVKNPPCPVVLGGRHGQQLAQAVFREGGGGTRGRRQ